MSHPPPQPGQTVEPPGDVRFRAGGTPGLTAALLVVLFNHLNKYAVGAISAEPATGVRENAHGSASAVT